VVLLELKQLVKKFSVDNQPFFALNGIDTSFEKGEFVAIVGPSGCGKSTLLNIIAGLDTPDGGDLLIEGKSTKGYSRTDWDLYRRFSIGFVFQNFNLVEHLDALENIEVPLSLIGMPKGERAKRAKELLAKVGLDGFGEHRPSELSGGQKQRVAIARALANDPDVILADEPTGSLDQKTGVQILELLKEVAADKLIILVTHNQTLAKTYSSRIVYMLDGKIVDQEDVIQVEANTVRSELTKKNSSMSFAQSFKLSLRNMKGKLGRIAITTIAGCIGIAGIALVLGLSNGANTYIDSQLNKFATANILAVEKTYQEGEEVLASANIRDFDDIIALDKVVSIRPALNLSGVQVMYGDEKLPGTLSGLADSGYRTHLRDNYQGSLPDPESNSLLVNETFARAVSSAKGLDPGETDLAEVIGAEVVLALPSAEEGGQHLKTFTISGLAGEFDLGSPAVYYDYANIQAWLESITAPSGEDYFTVLTADVSNFEITLARAQDNLGVYEWILEPENGGVGQRRGGMGFGFGRGRRTGFAASSFSVLFKTIFSQMLSIAQTVLLFFVFCALIVSCIMTAIVLHSSVLERKTEIGTIKAVGGSDRDVIRIFQSEAVLIGLLAGALGIAVAFALQPLLNLAINSAVDLDVPAMIQIPLLGIPFTDTVFPLATIILLLAISVAVASVAGWLPSRRATKMAVIDALRDE
jgi:putative ABC transport system permease protein